MSEWSQIKSLEMLVSKSELNLEINKDSDFLFFSCDLLNVARGRCDIILKRKNIKKNNLISISTKKSIMESKIYLSEKKFSEVLDSISKLSNINNKKLKIILTIDKPLAVNNSGVLSLDEDIKIVVTNLKLILPII